MDTWQIVLTATTAIMIPAIIAEVRYRSAQRRRFEEQEKALAKLGLQLEFLERYLLKNAVLEFHNNPNPKTDKIIEKLNADEPISNEEMAALKNKLKDLAEHAPERKKQLRAQNALELIEWQESVKQQTKARNDLFNA